MSVLTEHSLPSLPLPSAANFGIFFEDAMIGIAAACGFTHPPQKLLPHFDLEIMMKSFKRETRTMIRYKF